MNPGHKQLYDAARARAQQQPKKRGLSNFARSPVPKTPGSGFKRQQSY